MRASCAPRLLLVTALVCTVCCITQRALARLPGSEDAKRRPVQGDYMRPDVSPVEILEAKGYRAKEFYFTTEDGYILNIVRGTNPLFNRGQGGLSDTLPLLFVAGTDISVSVFLTNAYGVRPMNFRKRVDLAEMANGTQLIELLDHDPSVRSLPFLAMNFGYECWFIQRRGYGKSSEKVGHQNRTLVDAIRSIPMSLLNNGWTLMAGMEAKRPRMGMEDPAPSGVKLDKRGRVMPGARVDEGLSAFWRDFAQQAVSLDNLPSAMANFGEFEKNFIHTFDPDFWNFSLDEPAKYDIPQAIEFVLRKSGKPRLHITGVSSGGAVILLAAAEQPQLAEKIASAVLWAPSLNMGSSSDITYLLSTLMPMVESYSGPIPFVFVSRQMVGMLQSICATRLAQKTICARLVDILFGYSGDQTHITQANIAAFIQPQAAHELFHLGQMAHTPVPCKYNFSTHNENMRHYGQPEAPCYDLGKIELEHVSIYQGNTDGLVSYMDLQVTVNQMRVPVDVHYLNEPGLYFNHGGTLFHDECGRLAIAPSLLDMFRAEQSLLASEVPTRLDPFVGGLNKLDEWTGRPSGNKNKKFLSKFNSRRTDHHHHHLPRKSNRRPLMSKSYTTRPGNQVTDYFF